MLFTYGLQNYCFLGQAKLNRLCGLCQKPMQVWTVFWFKNDSKYLDVKLKVFKKDYNKEFRLVQNLTAGDADFNEFMRLRNQLVSAAENYARQKNLFPVVKPTFSDDMDEQFKLPHKVVNVVDRAYREISVTLVRYSVVKSENSCAQIRIFARKREEEQFQQIVYVNYKLGKLICLFDVWNSV